MSHRYVVRHEVFATTRFEAITKAGDMLWSHQRLIEVGFVEEVTKGFWHVQLWVAEDA